ncbi:MAG: hypothetical protein JXR25_15090 [Pontiellaceae bacterium]|nr:hypothetical protein [Pontiellaceae bacterium]MBN2786145.1 hypothetical protein [Pontiellaceae bacterium]
MKTIAYYITAHGYGHGARSCDILNALHIAAPHARIIAVTDLPDGFMRSRIPESIELRAGAFDIGLIQKDSIQVDLEASLKALDSLYVREKELLRQETDFFAHEKIGVVVADIPALPLAAAQQAGIPNIATSNFGWDWIYEEFAEHDPHWKIYVDRFRRVYANTELLLRQPFSEPMTTFPNRINLPLLAKPGKDRRDAVARKTGADPARQWVLLSFTSLNLDQSALKNLSRLNDCELFSVEPLEWSESSIHCISRSHICFADILASVDVVVTKPGFGILSECIANNKPIIYTDRANFREYPVLVDCIREYCRHAFIPNAELYAGRLTHALETIKNAPAPLKQMLRGGAELAASEILKRLP